MSGQDPRDRMDRLSQFLLRVNGVGSSNELTGRTNLVQAPPGAAPSHVNLAALGGGSLGNGVIEPPRCASCMNPGLSTRSTSSRTSSNGHGTVLPTSQTFQSRNAPHGHSGHHGQGLSHEPHSLPSTLPPAPLSTPPLESSGGSAFPKRTVNSECIAGMDMIGELFQQQAKRLEVQLYQQLRDQAEIEHIQSQLAATSQHLKRLQVQNMELRRLVDANEMNIRAMYEHAKSVQQAQNGLLKVCDSLAEDAALLRRALREQCPERAHEFDDVPRPALPSKFPQLPPLDELLPPPGPANGETNGGNASQHMETALALLSTVASHKADTSSAQPDHGDNGGSDVGSNDQDSNQGSNGSNQSSSNQGTEDTVLVNSNGDSSNGNGSSHSKESSSPDEADSGDGNGSSHGSDSGDGGNAHAESGSNGGSEGNGECKRGGKGSSNGDSDSNGDSLPIGDGSAGTSASRSDSNSSSPPHELDVEPPQHQIPPAGAKRKR